MSRYHLGFKGFLNEQGQVEVLWFYSDGNNAKAARKNTHPLLYPHAAGKYVFDFSGLDDEDVPPDIVTAGEIMAAHELLFHGDSRSPFISKEGSSLPSDGHGLSVYFSREESVFWVRARSGDPKMALLSQRLFCAFYEASVSARITVMPNKPITGKKWKGCRTIEVDFSRLLKYREGYIVRSPSIGRIQITPHALERYAQRLRKTTYSLKERERPLWSLVRFLTHAVFRPAEIAKEDVIEHKKRKYGRLFFVTRYWKAEVKELYLVTIPHDTIPKLSILVTVFFRPDRNRGMVVKG